MYVISFLASFSCWVFCDCCVCLLLFAVITLLVWADEDAGARTRLWMRN